MRVRKASAYIVMVIAGGILLCAGSPTHAGQSKGESSSTGESAGAMKQSQKSDPQSSGKMKPAPTPEPSEVPGPDAHGFSPSGTQPNVGSTGSSR
jgi:hypothetical protein